MGGDDLRASPAITGAALLRVAPSLYTATAIAYREACLPEALTSLGPRTGPSQAVFPGRLGDPSAGP
jgi:hypothetical protein